MIPSASLLVKAGASTQLGEESSMERIYDSRVLSGSYITPPQMIDPALTGVLDSERDTSIHIRFGNIADLYSRLLEVTHIPLELP
jgi:hypothetical protein